MKKSIVVKLSMFAVAIALAIAIPGSAPKAHAQDSQLYFYCTVKDGVHSTAFYSDVFPGDSSQRVGYEVAFTNYVHGHFSNVIGVASCFSAWGPSQARSAEDGWRSTDSGIYGRLVDTRWTY